jgi:hypothetical protein
VTALGVPAVTDTAQARACARTIAGWKLLPAKSRSVIAPAGGLIGLSQQLPVRPGRPLGPACPTESERAPVTIQAKIGSD